MGRDWERTMRKFTWDKFIHSWWGRSLAGAFIGGLLVAFANVQSPGIFLLGMAAGALILFLLGRWK
jgi:hypothetical protein